MAQGTHNYALERSYYYDSHDENGHFSGLTKDDWKKMILEDWSAEALKANHVVIIFHNKDKDENGNLKELHAHACANTVNTITQSAMMKLAKCSCEENCTAIKDKAKAYKYMLHITQKAIADKKHVYDEDCLIFSVRDDKTFDINDYHKIIASKKQVSEDDKADKELIDDTINKILEAYYGDGYDNSQLVCSVSEQRIYDEIIMNNDIVKAMSRSPQLHKKVMNAIKLRADITRVGIKQMRANGLSIPH